MNKNDDARGGQSDCVYLSHYQQKHLRKLVERRPVYTANCLGSETMDVLNRFVSCVPTAQLP